MYYFFILIIIGKILRIECHETAISQNQKFQFNKNHKITKFNEDTETITEPLTNANSNPNLNSDLIDIMNDAHAINPIECLNYLQSNANTGLSTSETLHRLQIFGLNTIVSKPKDSLFTIILEQFQDRLVQILLIVALFSSLLAFLERDFHNLTEPIVILIILIGNAMVGIYHSKSAEGSMEALKQLQPQFACVLRDGKWYYDIPSSNLVPGDIISLRVGDKVPADARMLSLRTSNAKADESSLTGESMPVSKSIESLPLDTNLANRYNMLYGGTLITTGSIIAVITSTGPNTQIGKISAGVEAVNTHSIKTPLGEKLDKFSNQLSRLVGVICICVWLVNIPNFKESGGGSILQGALRQAKVAVALGVAAIPEGLPAVVTLCLSLGTRRMAERNVVVRRLASVETLGCTSVICTDKTGTLTTNQMVVKTLITFASEDTQKRMKKGSELSTITEANNDNDNNDDNNLNEDYIRNTIILASHKENSKKRIYCVERGISGNSYDPRDGNIQISSQIKSMSEISAICALCNQAEIQIDMNSKRGINDHHHEEFKIVGEPTEAALRVLVEKIGRNYLNISVSNNPNDINIRASSNYWDSQYEQIAILEFSRERKRMSVLSRGTSKQGKPMNRLFVKGAAEMMLLNCNRIQLEDGNIVNINSEMLSQLHSAIKELSSRPLRCVALAYVDGKQLRKLNKIKNKMDAVNVLKGETVADYEHYEKDMVLVGVCGIKDPPRAHIAQSMKSCHEAGIRVMMITGDSRETAVAIAQEVGILPRNNTKTSPISSNPIQDPLIESAFTTKSFFSKSEEDQMRILSKGNKVFCRAEPRDKQILIGMLEKLGEVTAMTGDGVNDAPALKQADIGIAMGIAGTEVAKQAADMLLTDDDFASIIAAVEEGRNIFTNMQAFISFLLSCNLGEIAAVLFAALLRIPTPLSPLHLLWVNLVTDGPPATALGFNPPDPYVMKRLPRPRHDSLLTPLLLVRYCITGGYVGLASLAAYLYGFSRKGISFDKLRQSMDSRDAGLVHSQSMALSVLVVVEMLKALSAVSLSQSLFRVPPWTNPYLLASVILPLSLHGLLIHIPFLAKLFGVSALSIRDWIVITLLALPILLLEEGLKLYGRWSERNARKESVFDNDSH